LTQILTTHLSKALLKNVTQRHTEMHSSRCITIGQAVSSWSLRPVPQTLDHVKSLSLSSEPCFHILYHLKAQSACHLSLAPTQEKIKHMTHDVERTKIEHMTLKEYLPPLNRDLETVALVSLTQLSTTILTTMGILGKEEEFLLIQETSTIAVVPN
jgi:lipoate synthase